MPRRWAAAAIFIGATMIVGPARADNVEDARRDYEAGAAAYDRRDWATAAVRFSRADERVPNPRALQLAMASATHLTDAPLAMSLVERAEARAVDGSLAELAKRLRTRFAKEVGHVRVTCPSKCEASVNGHVAMSHWLTPGTYRVKFENGEKEITLTLGAELEVSPPTDAGLPAELPPKRVDPVIAPLPPPLPPEKPKDETHGLRPWLFWTGVGATGAAAIVAGAFTLDSMARHDDFIANKTDETAAAGEAAQTRAVVAWSVTGAFLVATVVVAFLTDFGK